MGTPGFTYGLAISGNLALAADSSSGLRVIDITDPSTPAEVGFLDTPGTSQDVAVSGDLALVADGNTGLAIVRFIPVQPPLAGDANRDGMVNMTDMRLVTAALGTSNPMGDLNADGVVNIFGLVLVVRALFG